MCIRMTNKVLESLKHHAIISLKQFDFELELKRFWIKLFFHYL